MGDEDDGLAKAAPQREQIVIEAELRDLIERRERLIHQEDVGIGDERARERHPHLHAAGQFTRKGVGEIGKPNAGQRLIDACAGLGLRHASKLQRQPYVFAHAGPGHQGRLLEHETDAMPWPHLALMARHPHRAGRRHTELCDQAQCRRLAAPGRAQQ